MAKKKQDGGLKKKFIFFLLFFILSHNTLNAQILDYESEKFINQIIEDISKINNVNKKIKFKIINNNEINAYVDFQNVIHINSGLIQYSEDYIALLSVLAHEIGHIDLNHISLRKKSIEDNKKYNNLSILSVIAGTALTKSPDFLQTSIVSSAALSNKYIDFTKEQEMDADLYALKTLDSMNIYSDSIIKLLETIEEKLSTKGFSRDAQRISTHPYFEDRILLIKNFKDNKNNNFNTDYNNRFNYIKAKFIGYSDNHDMINYLDEPFKTYAESIKYARNGNLKMSLEGINQIIEKDYNNSFLMETKADILYSHGFTNEAVKFYKKNLKQFPFNYYAHIRIFENIETKELSLYEIENIFEENKVLLYKFFNNKNILLKYLNLAQQLNKGDWINFLNFYLSIEQKSKEQIFKKINYFKKTKDMNLLEFINKIESSI